VFGLFKKKKELLLEPEMNPVPQDFENIQKSLDYVREVTGINFEKQQAIFQSKLKSFCQQRDINSFDECLNKVARDSSLKQELVNYVTTNETYFYREFEQIKTLVDSVCKRIDKVDILSMPCSTGEEPYTIAIALLEAGVATTRFNLLGVDIDTSALQRSKEGVYNARDVSKMPTDLVDKYFTKQGDKFYLNSLVKSCVTFNASNLFDSEFKKIGQFDYVLSRNMLIYFDMDTKLKASKILDERLKPGSEPVYYGHADLY
jgi:chemotaxis protein methyltransferase CheR